MAASVTFNGNAIAKELDLLTQVQLPFLASVTVNRLATQVRADLKHEMQDSFKRVSKFTLNSVRQNHFATKAEPWTEVFHLQKATKGNAAADYLKPQITGGMVFRTRFQLRLNSQLSGYNGRYMLPLETSPAAKKNSQGRVRASQYVEALYGVKAMDDIIARAEKAGDSRGQRANRLGDGKYLYVPFGPNDEKAKAIRALNKGRLPSPGIYRVYRGNSIVQLFKQLENVPTVQKSYDFRYAAELSVSKNVNRIFNEAVAQYVKR